MRQPDDELIRALYPRLRRFACVVTSADDDPDDLVQDTLFRVLRRGELARLDEPANVGGVGRAGRRRKTAASKSGSDL